MIFQSWFFHYLRQSSFKNGNHSLQEKKREKDSSRKINRKKRGRRRERDGKKDKQQVMGFKESEICYLALGIISSFGSIINRKKDTYRQRDKQRKTLYKPSDMKERGKE